MIRHFPDPDGLAKAAAAFFVEQARGKERFLVALSGGSTPRRMYEELVGADVDWGRVVVGFSDERFVPSGHPESNEGMARRALLDRVPIPEGNILSVFGPGTVEARAAAYEEEIRRLGGDFDLVLLGMGTDGHTASLFPGDPSVAETRRWVAASRAPKGIAERVTFTLPLLAQARKILFLVSGADKREAWQAVQSGSDLPTRRILDARPDANVFLCL